MRDVTAALQAHLDGEATQLCQCWRVLCRNGRAFGFTDHDETLVFDGVRFEADTGLQAQSRDERMGLASGLSDVSGAFTQLNVDEAALADGVLDGASVETWLVQWSDPAQRLLMNVETIGDVRRTENGFVAELRSLADVFEQETGRRFLKTCSADLGDARCKVDLQGARYTGRGRVVESLDASHATIALQGYDDHWFAAGRLRILSGAQTGAVATIRAHRQAGVQAHVTLWTPLAQALTLGDEIELRAGCDKSFATCGDKFSNRVNFRGFPHIPGNDILLANTSSETIMDGGSLFR